MLRRYIKETIKLVYRTYNNENDFKRMRTTKCENLEQNLPKWFNEHTTFKTGGFRTYARQQNL